MFTLPFGLKKDTHKKTKNKQKRSNKTKQNKTQQNQNQTTTTEKRQLLVYFLLFKNQAKWSKEEALKIVLKTTTDNTNNRKRWPWERLCLNACYGHFHTFAVDVPSLSLPQRHRCAQTQHWTPTLSSRWNVWRGYFTVGQFVMVCKAP